MDVLSTVVSMSGLVFVLALLVNTVAVPAVALSRVRLSGRAVVSVLKESLSYGKTPIDSC